MFPPLSAREFCAVLHDNVHAGVARADNCTPWVSPTGRGDRRRLRYEYYRRKGDEIGSRGSENGVESDYINKPRPNNHSRHDHSDNSRLKWRGGGENGFKRE